MGSVSGLSLASCLAWPGLDLTQGSFWWHVTFSAKKDSGRSVPPLCALVAHFFSPLTTTPFFFFFVFLPFLGPLLRHMEVPRLGVKLEL